MFHSSVCTFLILFTISLKNGLRLEYFVFKSVYLCV